MDQLAWLSLEDYCAEIGWVFVTVFSVLTVLSAVGFPKRQVVRLSGPPGD